MFTGPALPDSSASSASPASPTSPTSPSSPSSPSSPPRSSRLRGLSYLRNYTHAHLPSSHSSTTVNARSGQRRSPSPVGAAPAAPAAGAASLAGAATADAPAMTRARPDPAAPQPAARSSPRSHSAPAESDNAADSQATASAQQQPQLPSIRFVPHQDPRAARPSLGFPSVTRTVANDGAVIRVGRYSERDHGHDIAANLPTTVGVGFKSKVVSRKHCEFWCSNGQWYVKDVKSSSGTFLNHIRLSQPNIESKPCKVNHGDILQLGIDFRGGEETIYRCVKIRLECNLRWQLGPSNFNKQTHQRLRNLGKQKDSDSGSTHTSECSICLMSIAPCQSLFVAPCSHVWHYKCIRPILNGNTWPNFLCPNCRSVTDLEADIDDMSDGEMWEDELLGAPRDSPSDLASPSADEAAQQVTPRASRAPLLDAPRSHLAPHLDNPVIAASPAFGNLESELSAITDQLSNSLDQLSISPASAPAPVPVPVSRPVPFNVMTTRTESADRAAERAANSLLTPGSTPDCPMTPRNDAGPFVID